MTEEEIIQFYRDNRQWNRLDTFGEELLKMVKDYIVAGAIIEKRAIPDLSRLNLDKSYIWNMDDPESRRLIVESCIGRTDYGYIIWTHYREGIDLKDLCQCSNPGEIRLKHYDKCDDEKMDKLLLEIGEIHEGIDKRWEAWRKYHDSKRDC